MTTQDHREAFEKWALTAGLRIRRHDIRDYWYSETMGAYSVWNAAMRHRDELEKGND